ncbi:MAG: NAD-dependent epimerase/dehydratase family protein [Actinomycetes bacterium]
MQQSFPWSEVSVYIAGHNGLVGSAIWRALEAEGVGKLIGWRSAELDLCDRGATFGAINEAKPDVPIEAAAKGGGT